MSITEIIDGINKSESTEELTANFDLIDMAFKNDTFKPTNDEFQELKLAAFAKKKELEELVLH